MAKNEQAKATTHAVRPRSRRTAKNAPNQAPPRVAMAKPNRQPESTARAPPESNGYPKASSVKLAMAPRAPTRASPTGLPSRERTKPGRHHPGPLAPRAAKKAAEKTRNAARATRISCQPMASRSMAAVPRETMIKWHPGSGAEPEEGCRGVPAGQKRPRAGQGAPQGP